AAAQAPAVHGIGPRMGEIVDAAAAGAVAPEEQPALEDLPRGVEQEEAVDLDPARAKSLDELERLVGRARNTVQHEAAPAGLGHPPLEHVHNERRGRHVATGELLLEPPRLLERLGSEPAELGAHVEGDVAVALDQHPSERALSASGRSEKDQMHVCRNRIWFNLAKNDLRPPSP